MKLLIEFWPVIVGAVGALAVWISRLQVKNAKQERDRAISSAKAVKKVVQAHNDQLEAAKEGEAMAQQIIEDAHEKGSDGDLTKSTY